MVVTNTKKWETELHLTAPWRIDDISFKPSELSRDNGTKKQEERHILLSYKRGTLFADETGTPCPVHDTYNKTWRHLDHEEQRCYVRCKVPRIQTTEGKVKLIHVPWARQGSNFTLCFEAHILQLLSKNQPFNSICAKLHETSDRILPIFNHWMHKAYLAQHIDPNIDAIGIGEQSNDENTRHITMLIDLKNQRVLFVIEGKTQEAVQQIKHYLKNKGINILQIKHISGNLFNQTVLTELKSCFPKATLYYDRFYVLQLLNDAMDDVSNTETKNIKRLAKHLTLFRTDPSHLSAEQKTMLLQLTTKFPNLEKAYRLKILFNNLWEQKSIQDAAVFLESWCHAVEETRLIPFKNFVNTIQQHQNSIINFTSTPENRTVIERTLDKTQQIKSLKSGLRNIENFSNMIYLLFGKLSFPSYSEYTNKDT